MVGFRVDASRSTPLVQQIQQGFKARILSHELPGGTRLPSIRRMSREFGCSPGIVERATASLTAEGFLDAEPRRGFFVSHTAGQARRSRDVALVLPSLRLEAMSCIIQGVREGLGESGFRLLVQSADEDYDDQLHLLEYLRHSELAGVVIAPPIDDTYAAPIRDFALRGTPVVLATRVLDDCDNLDTVTVDNLEYGRTAISYLLDRGHRRIATVGCNTASLANRQVLEGIEAGLRRHRMTPEDLVQIPLDTFEFNLDRPWQNAAEAVGEFLDGDTAGVTALLGWSHYMSLGAFRALSERGIPVPDAVSLLSMGHNMEAFSVLQPAITVVQNPFRAVSERAARRLVEVIERGDDPAQQIRVAPALIEGQSVAALR